MKLEINRESADALYQLAQYLPVTMNVMAEQALHLAQVYQSVSDSVGPHAEQFREMLECIRTAVSDSSDTVAELAPQFTACADRIMEVIDTDPSQPELILKKR